ncbi:hypothetical protein BFJ63_vAg5338 [Fusarium oxysporum f. sp. narcissi]|uniref:Uncharacterized protein n=2 Tax=Fusarium oxysporum TaxID=5507 RepID=A0A4Q2VYG9_FUSOX|nr:hypothetical protein BFJ63_vAg5338 [Fusarium oxysporum f. sp. narcissi]
MLSRNEGEGCSLKDLDIEHYTAFERSLRRMLDTDVAERAYSEVFDGMPLRDSYLDLQFPEDRHPALKHVNLSEGVRERVFDFRSKFDLSSLWFETSLLQAFSKASAQSKEFHLRLLELLAVSCHQIAVQIFQLDDVAERHNIYDIWRHSPRDMTKWDSFRDPTAFSHGPYIAVDQYPNGAADSVGYWAEARIFGGVVVFDRGEDGTESRQIYFHGCRRKGPRTIYTPIDQQFEQMIQFLLDESESHDTASAHPFPVLATSQNRWRWDPWEAMAHYNIYRDRFERKISSSKGKLCVLNSIDWPEVKDDLYLINAMLDQLGGKPVDEDKIASAKEGLTKITPSSPLWSNEARRYQGI